MRWSAARGRRPPKFGCLVRFACRTLTSAMSDDPELYIFRPPDPGEAWRAEQERKRDESHRRLVDRLMGLLALADAVTEGPRARAEAVLDGLFLHRYRESGDPCHCGCHPRLPESDLHDDGSDCPCRRTAEERQAGWDAWIADRDAFWESPEGREITARHRAEEADLAAWLDDEAGVTVSSHGGLAPEQWKGTVDGHSFYFRERHDDWRIELDLAPTGRRVEIWTGADPDDEAARRWREVEEGEVIAEGTTAATGYGATSLERALFIVGEIRTHLRRQTCPVHTAERDDIELLLGRPLDWCPACGTRLPLNGLASPG